MTSSKRPLLYLVNPGCRYPHYATQPDLSRMLGKKKMTVPVQLPLLAALTPAHWEIRIVDEEMGPLVTAPRPDLVGVTTLSAVADRAMEIGDLYRAMGVPVVMGGSYATVRPEHCLEHADHVVIGEAEGAWQRFLAEFERGAAEKIYQNETVPEFRTSPVPRWDLVDTARIMTIGVETARGCPFACDFCVVNRMFGRRMRFRDVDDVIAEIEAIGSRAIFFVADNFAINKAYAREIVERLKPMGITWFCQTSIHVAEDPELLRAMAEAGCTFILMGFESLNEASLEGVKKHHNKTEEFGRAIERIHAAGIHVLASFIVGFEEDTLETFGRIREFIRENDLLFTILNIMAVSPGTALYERMNADGRAIAVESSYRNGTLPSARYNHLSQRQMLDAFVETLDWMFDWESLDARAAALFGTGRFASARKDTTVTRLQKARSVLTILNRFALTRDRAKRALFLRLLKMVREGTLSPDQMVVFLFHMESMHAYLDRFHRELPGIRARIEKIDLGPWIEDPACKRDEGAARGVEAP